MPIIKRPYSIFSDCGRVYDFLNSIYTRNWANGTPGTYFEYAQTHPNFQPQEAHRIALWEDEGEIAAMSAFETTLGEAFFAVKPGYEHLADALIDHAEKHIHTADEAGFALWDSQTVMREAAARRGYECVARWPNKCYDYSKGALDYPLPEGYRFFDEKTDGELDPLALQRCIFLGFDHEGKEEFIPDPYIITRFRTAPHSDPRLPVIILSSEGECVCYAGMWYVPQTRLAYLEPLCTVPKHRRRGLAAAALSELYRRTKALGADHMTGGGDEFYTRIGFEPWYYSEIWHKKEK